MTKNSKMKLAKVLIAFSLVFIFIGIGLNLNNKAVINPVTGTHVISNGKDNDISITTTNIPITTDSGQQNDNNQTDEEHDSSNNATPSTGVNKDPATSSGGNSSNLQVKESQVSSIGEINNNLRTSIQNKYGITVRYGAETNGYTIAGLSSIMLNDENRINEVLSSLNYNLSLYPNGFFTETKQANYSLTIYLIKRYSQENVTGITDSTTKNIVISLATDYSFVDSLHHELYHYIEKYLYYKGANYTTWNTLNPQGFNYGAANTSLSYANTNDPYAFFVNTYAQTDEYEDRASTFEYLMANTEANCLITGTTIWKKAKYMCEQIDAVFQTVSPSVTEYWERYVYN